eukprot:PhF_6_TR32146/c0_g2_i2/m.47629
MTDQQDNSQNPEDQSHAYHPNSRKIFVEGLPFQRTPQTDEALYALCAAVNIPSIIRLVQKKGYGFGYLLFKTESAAKLALKRLNGQELYGRSLRVEVPKEMHRTVPVQQASMEVGTLWRRQVLLLNIPYAVNAEILEEVLNDHLPLKVRAAVENIKLMRHGKAFVTFQDEGAVETLLAEYGGGGGSGGEKKKTMFVMGQELEVSRALPPTQTRGRPPTNESIAEAYSNKSKTVIAKRPREEDNDEQQQQVEEEHQHQQQQEENVAQPQQQPQRPASPTSPAGIVTTTLTPTSSVEDVVAFLAALNLSKDYGPIVRDQQLDGDVMLSISESDLESLGMGVFGDRRKILKALAQMSK